MKVDLAGIDVVVLAGGLGTRLRDVLGYDIPKVLAPIGGRTCLDLIIDWLEEQGARRLVLCLGHLASRVTDHLAARPPGPAVLVQVIEPEPLGTAGAVRQARPVLKSDPVMVMNGDTFIDADLGAFTARHRSSGAAVSLLAVEADNTDRYGRLELNTAGFIAKFIEKDAGRSGAGLASAGIHLFSAGMLDFLAAMPGPSLERDVLQRLPAGTIRGDVVRGPFVDIGTPESLAWAATMISSRRFIPPR